MVKLTDNFEMALTRTSHIGFYLHNNFGEYWLRQ